MAGTILLADDSPHARRMGSQYLSDMGYAVVTAADGEAALAALGQLAPELILVDAALPGMPDAGSEGELGGMALCQRVKAEPAWRTIPVLVLVGALSQPTPGELAGADGVLRKPLSSAGLESWLSRGRRREAGAGEQLSREAMLERAVQEAALGS